MRRVLTVEEIVTADKFTINELGIPAEVLMERAGIAVVEEIVKAKKGGRVIVVCGIGNNGGDGKVIAKELAKIHGFKVTCVGVEEFNEIPLDRHYDIIVDCIFGTGLKRTVDGACKIAIDKINASNLYVISCDVPSGINCDTGFPYGVAVKANLTVAVQELKLGHFLNDGKDYSGRALAKDIGISIWTDECAYVYDDEDVAKHFPERTQNTNKGNYGKSAIVGGSRDFVGAAMLSANSLTALKTGIGYSYLYVPRDLFPLYANKNPECIVSTFKDDNGFLTYDEDALKKLLKFDSIGFGMGVGVSEDNYKILTYLLKNYKGKLLIDADGLNTLSKYGVEVLKKASCKVVLTPHVKEFSFLSGYSTPEILQDGVAKAKAFAKKYGVTLALKSSVSIITDGKDVCLNVTGNSGLAKAGSGDVLSGLITGLNARIDDVFESAKVGCYILGKACEIATKKQNEYTVTASDVIACIGTAINKL